MKDKESELQQKGEKKKTARKKLHNFVKISQGKTYYQPFPVLPMSGTKRRN